MTTVINIPVEWPLCPVHGTEMRVEQLTTAICMLCPKRYDLCSATRFMERCAGLAGHDGDHATLDGVAFAKLDHDGPRDPWGRH